MGGVAPGIRCALGRSARKRRRMTERAEQAMEPVVLVPMRPSHWKEVERIYAEGIATGNATFETATAPWESWDEGHLPNPRLVALDEAGVLGWAALSRVSRRPAYAGVAEVSVYVTEQARGRGIGLALLRRLVAESEEAGIWTLQASIFPENVASVALHERVDFRVVGRRERIGRLHGTWRDTLLLERRSPVVQ